MSKVDSVAWPQNERFEKFMVIPPFLMALYLSSIAMDTSAKPVFLLEVSRDLWSLTAVKKTVNFLQRSPEVWNRVPCSRDVPNEWVFSSKNTGFADVVQPWPILSKKTKISATSN